MLHLASHFPQFQYKRSVCRFSAEGPNRTQWPGTDLGLEVPIRLRAPCERLPQRALPPHPQGAESPARAIGAAAIQSQTDRRVRAQGRPFRTPRRTCMPGLEVTSAGIYKRLHPASPRDDSPLLLKPAQALPRLRYGRLGHCWCWWRFCWCTEDAFKSFPHHLSRTGYPQAVHK